MPGPADRPGTPWPGRPVSHPEGRCAVWVADPGGADRPGAGLEPVARHAVEAPPERAGPTRRAVTIHRLLP